MTNLDNIRQMNSEELAKALTERGMCAFCRDDIPCTSEISCYENIKSWLEQEVTPTLTDDEKVILRNIGGNFKTIKRNDVGTLYLECDSKICKYQELFSCYNNLFDFIEDGKSYEISKLLGE